MAGERSSASAPDPFTAFWTDFVSRMSAAGAAPPSPSSEFMNQMRRAFFDAMTQYADQFMRSEAFLAAMKQSTDHALAWQQSMNQVLQKGLSAGQMPSRADADHVVSLIRGMEDRLLEKLDRISERVDRIESEHEREPHRGRRSART